MKPIEEVDFDRVVDMCKLINEVCDNKIEVIGKTIADKKELLDMFTVRMEGMSEEDQDKVPGAVEFYNEVYSDEAAKEEKKERATDASGEKKEPVKKEPVKKEKRGAKAEKKPRKKTEPKKPKEPKQIDDFGYTVGTKNNLFIQSIKNTPMTMKEIRDLPWNDKKVTFYEEFKKLRNSGKADKDEQGRMFVK